MDETELLNAFEECTQSGDYKTAAICAFVLARRKQKDEDLGLATHYGRESIRLLAECSQELADCTHPYITIAGVFIPGIFHEGTVRRELSGLNL